jgi:hypothetical protein
MAEQLEGVYTLAVAEALLGSLERAGFADSALYATDIALCLAASVTDLKGIQGAPKEAFKMLALAALSIRQAARQVGLDLPVVLVVALEGRPMNWKSYGRLRGLFDTWEADQDWHRGDFALYLCPPVALSGKEAAQWTGPSSRSAMVQHLLGKGAGSWGLSRLERSSVASVAGQLEAWARDNRLGPSHPHGDLLITVAQALRDLDRARRQSRNDELRAIEDADRAVHDWVARHLQAASDPEASLETPA